MRIIHISDIHFGIENYSRLDAQSGLPTRLIDFRDAFNRAIDFALSEGVDAVIFTGDAYKNRDPGATVQREFARCIQRLVAGGIPVFLLTGNHDLPNTTNRAHSIEIFETLAIPGVTVARQIEKYIIQTKSGPLQIVSLPWLTRTNLLVREEYKGRTLAELDELMLQRIENTLQLRVRELDPHIPAILAVHGTIDGATFGSERSIMLGQDMVLQKTTLMAEHFDYIAVGHLHKHQQLYVGDTPIVYAGSIERIDFGEEKEDKGYVLIELDAQAGSRFLRRRDWRFQPDWHIRPFSTVEIELEDVTSDELLNPTSAALQQLERFSQRHASALPNAVVRLKIKLRADQEAALRDEELRRALNEYGVYYIAAINREVDRQRRTRLAGFSAEELSPLDLLNKYLETKNVPAPRVELLLKHAKVLIEGSVLEEEFS